MRLLKARKQPRNKQSNSILRELRRSDLLKPQMPVCGCRGKVGHYHDKRFFFQNKRCNKCRRLGHIAKMCWPAKAKDNTDKSAQDT